MPLMAWNEKLSVGVKQLDDDHKQLVGMVNELYDGITTGKAKELVGPLLDKLIRYTVEHFKHEEDFFAKTGYPETSKHVAFHKDLTSQVLAVQKAYKEGARATLSLEVMNFLKNWLVTHIQGEDKKYGPFLNAKGIH